MAAEESASDIYSPSDESMSEPDWDSTDSPVVQNPLYSLATSKSDHSSLGRQSASGLGDQAVDESPRAARAATGADPDDTTSDVRSGDVSKTVAGSSGSLPLVASLQISRPPQSAAVSDDQQQQSSAVKAPPPPVVPVRLLRTPSSAKPATDVPKVDCPEKIVRTRNY